MPDHSPEPWRVDEDPLILDIIDANCKSVLPGDCYAEEHHMDGYLKDMRRIVACVNAMAGINDPEQFVCDARHVARHLASRFIGKPDSQDVRFITALNVEEFT